MNLKFTKSIYDFMYKMTLTLDSKSKEADDLFTSATRKIEESLKKSNQFLNKEVDHAKKSVLNLAKITDNQLDSYSTCVNHYNKEIQNIKKKFSDKIKTCTEKTVIGIETVRSKYENDLQAVRDLNKLTNRALKECLAKKGNIQACIDEKTKTANDKYKHMLEHLQEASKSSKQSVVQLLKTASVCYENAQKEVIENLPEIVEKTKICIDNLKVFYLIKKI